jgi:hypothetical protein
LTEQRALSQPISASVGRSIGDLDHGGSVELDFQGGWTVLPSAIVIFNGGDIILCGGDIEIHRAASL